ncbi:hypothetical protein TNCV_1144711 [Trichonephila clavipes]|nr:hypothetical protein TNCV_1144711 [Trichonephila clavipes]
MDLSEHPYSKRVYCMLWTEIPVPVYGRLLLQPKDLVTVHHVLLGKILLPFHVQRVQFLQPDDHPQGVAFAQLSVNQSATDMPNHAASVLCLPMAAISNTSCDALMSYFLFIVLGFFFL